MRFLALRLLAASIVTAASSAIAGAAPVAPPPAPRLIVAISVDQFAASVYGRYAGTFTGGLKLLSSGIVFPRAYQSHAATETCPGHSTLLTGDHPSHTGIVANSWFDRASNKSLYCVAIPGAADPSARGPQNLKASTLGEWLKQRSPASRVVAISGKDRAAIMMAGHNPDLVAWWSDSLASDKAKPGFQTSAFAGPSGPAVQAILDRENRKIAADWRSAPPRLWPATVPASCRALERPAHFGDIDISGAVPPVAAVQATARPDFQSSDTFHDALHASPLFDALTLDVAADIAERWQLGRRATPDLLAVSLSATDYVGHRYGNGGPEMCAQVHAIDASLAIFLQRIDRLGVPYIIVLTADHGSVDAPERLQAQGIDARRVDSRAFVADLNSRLKAALGIGWDPISGDDPQQLYIRDGGAPDVRARIVQQAMAWLRQQPAVATVFTSGQVAAAVPPPGKSAADLTIPERLNESFDRARSADIFVVFKPDTTLGWPRKVNDTVAGHGSPYDYDRQVPILFWWPGAPRLTSPAPVETVDIAPTLAATIGVAPPAIDGHCLTQVASCAAAPSRAVSRPSGERGR